MFNTHIQPDASFVPGHLGWRIEIQRLITWPRKLKLSVYNSQNSFLSPPFLLTSLAFQYGKQICFFGWNERLQAEAGRNARALFEELGAEATFVTGG